MALGAWAQAPAAQPAPPPAQLGALAPANIAKPRPAPPFDITGTWLHAMARDNPFTFALGQARANTIDAIKSLHHMQFSSGSTREKSVARSENDALLLQGDSPAAAQTQYRCAAQQCERRRFRNRHKG